MEKDNLADISFRKIVAYTLKKGRPALGFPEIIEERYLDLSTGEERCLKKNILHYNNEARIDQKRSTTQTGASVTASPTPTTPPAESSKRQTP